MFDLNPGDNVRLIIHSQEVEHMTLYSGTSQRWTLVTFCNLIHNKL